jgi:hypothetical protein
MCGAEKWTWVKEDISRLTAVQMRVLGRTVGRTRNETE